jgi:hypothetical protein
VRAPVHEDVGCKAESEKGLFDEGMPTDKPAGLDAFEGAGCDEEFTRLNIWLSIGRATVSYLDKAWFKSGS